MAEITVQARLISLHDVILFVHNPLDIEPNSIASEKYAANIKAYVRVSENKKTIGVGFLINIKSKDDIIPDNESSKEASRDDKFPSLHYEGFASFHVATGISFARNEQGGLVIPLPFMTRVAEVAYSTFRGVIYSKAGVDIFRENLLPMLSQEQYASIMSPDNIDFEITD